MKSLLDCHLLPYFVLQRTLIAAAFFCIKTLILQNIFCEAFFHLLHIGTPSLRIQVVSQCWPSPLFGFLLTCLWLRCPLSSKVHTIYIKCYVSAWPIYIYIHTRTNIQYLGQYSCISCVLFVFWPTSLITHAFYSIAHTKGNKKHSVL